MPRKSICMNCAMEFPSEEELQKHKDSGHKTKGESLAPPEVNLPNPEFLEAVERIEKGETNKPEVSMPNKLPDPKPISLTYVYTGECPTCRQVVTTLELDLEKEHFSVCYCNNCKKQIESRKVIKL